MTTQRTYTDSVLELATRTDFGTVYDLATTDEEAEAVLEAIAEVESEQQAASIADRLRRMGHTL